MFQLSRIFFLKAKDILAGISKLYQHGVIVFARMNLFSVFSLCIFWQSSFSFGKAISNCCTG